MAFYPPSVLAAAAASPVLPRPRVTATSPATGTGLVHQPLLAAPFGQQLNYYGRVGVAGGLCACAAHTVLVPIDVLKTMLQVNPTAYPTTGAAYKAVLASSGFRGLFKGLLPTSIGYFQQGFLKFALYEAFKPRAAEIVGKEAAAKNSLLLYMLCAGTAEVFASSLLVPWEALRIRQVSNERFYKMNVVRGFSTMVKESGTSVLYAGLPAILMKQLPYTVVQLSAFTTFLSMVYDDMLPRSGKTKEDLHKTTQLAISVGVGMFAGALSSIASHPGDAILTRINSALKAQARTADGAPAARPTIMQVASGLGVRGMMVGVWPRCAMTAGLSAIMFLVYDSCRMLMGLPASGGKK